MHINERRAEHIQKTMMLMIQTDKMHFCECERRFSSLNIHRSQHMMLMTIARMGEGVSQKQLAKEMNITPAAVAKLLKKLESDGLITRSSFSDDARENRTTITEKGAQIVERSHEIMKELDAEAAALLSDDELDTLSDLISKIQKSLCEMK